MFSTAGARHQVAAEVPSVLGSRPMHWRALDDDRWPQTQGGSPARLFDFRVLIGLAFLLERLIGVASAAVDAVLASDKRARYPCWLARRCVNARSAAAAIVG